MSLVWNIAWLDVVVYTRGIDMNVSKRVHGACLLFYGHVYKKCIIKWEKINVCNACFIRMNKAFNMLVILDHQCVFKCNGLTYRPKFNLDKY